MSNKNNKYKYALSIETIDGKLETDYKGFDTIEEIHEEIKQISKNGVIREGYFIPLHRISKITTIDLHNPNTKIVPETFFNKE